MIPLFFPNVVIYYLQMRGKLLPADETPSSPGEPTAPGAAKAVEPEDDDDDLGPCEV